MDKRMYNVTIRGYTTQTIYYLFYVMTDSEA